MGRPVDILERAEPGESKEKTALYSVLHTPESQLADFGIGVGLYFTSLRIMGFITLIAGLFNIPVIQYFRSTEYSSDAQESISTWTLMGSAICTDVTWEACPTCQRSDWDDFPSTHDRYATAVRNGEVLHFIQNNNCEVNETVGLFAFLALIWVFLALLAFFWYSIQKEVAFDEAQQTATDYSVEVENPPKDAFDPEEWRIYFGQFGGHVTVCTVALDNEDLIQVLTKRRQLLLSFFMGLPRGVEMDTSNLDGHLKDMPPKPLWKKLLCMGHYPELCKQIKDLDAKIEEMSDKKYDVSNVFVTFETEEAQRTVLKALSVRKLDVWRNSTDHVPKEQLFRGKHVLSVREPPEPSAVRWQDLDETFCYQVTMKIVTTIVSFAFIVAGGVCIAFTRARRSAAAAAYVIKALNIITPQLVGRITNLESHSSEGSKQTSQYIKMTAFRWCNTAIVTLIVTPFTDTAQDGNGHLVNGVYAIFLAELWMSPVLQLVDIMGTLNRHYFGPRAPDQRRMNLKFAGGGWQLSERYTDLTKVMFLCFFYSMIYPAGFFWTALTLFVTYWMDKFSLLRSWAPAPAIGTEISKFSRSYFFTSCLLLYSVMLAYGYSSFPYDNACDEETQVSQNYIGNYTATSWDYKTDDPVEVQISISPSNTNYFFCFQDLLRYSPIAFPPIPYYQPEGAEWMTPGQEQWSRILGWTMIGMLCVVSVIFANRTVFAALSKIFFPPYKPSGKAMKERFSEVEEIYGYVPQVKISGYPFPKLVCYVDDIDQGLVGWTDPYHPYDQHNLILDVPKVAKAVAERRSEKSTTDSGMVTDMHLFSIVKNWDPKKKEEEEEIVVPAIE